MYILTFNLTIFYNFEGVFPLYKVYFDNVFAHGSTTLVMIKCNHIKNIFDEEDEL